MKIQALLSVVVMVAAGCRTLPRAGNNPALKSERQYAVDSEARAQDLYHTGQASSLSEARAQAASEANAQWAAAAKAAEQRKKQEKFEKDLSKTLGNGG